MRKLWLISLFALLLAACGTTDLNGDDELETAAVCSRPSLTKGNTGPHVIYAQQQLLKKGNRNTKGTPAYYIYTSGGADGVYGTGTYNAVVAHQKSINALYKRMGISTRITVDGKIKDNTWRWLGCGTAPSVKFPNLWLKLINGQAEGYKQTYFDVNSSGNPLLDTRGKRNLKIAPNFTVHEFAHSGAKNFDFARIDPKLVQCVQNIRTSFGKPVSITSGYRSYSYNGSIDGATYSQHMSGRAADIKISGVNGRDIAKRAIDKCGCKIGVGIGASYAHVDVRGSWSKWKYGSAPQSHLDSVISHHKAKCGY